MNKRQKPINIESVTKNNKNYRKVQDTGTHMQLVLMNLKPDQEIGEEVHKNTDQFIRIESGIALLTLNGADIKMKKDEAIIIKAGDSHNIKNRSKCRDLKLYTIYSPPHHPKNKIQKNK